MTKKQRALEICHILKQVFPEALCQLNAETPFQLLVATRLSAQCTDKRVNEVTKILFKDYNTPEKMLTLKKEELAIKQAESEIARLTAESQSRGTKS